MSNYYIKQPTSDGDLYRVCVEPDIAVYSTDTRAAAEFKCRELNERWGSSLEADALANLKRNMFEALQANAAHYFEEPVHRITESATLTYLIEEVLTDINPDNPIVAKLMQDFIKTTQ